MRTSLFLALDVDAQLAIWLRLVIISDGREHRLFNRKKLDILSEQQNHRCCYCGVRFLSPPEWANTRKRHWKRALDGHPQMATIEHVVRLVDGGLRIWDNEVAACTDCNHRRQEVDAIEFFEHRGAIMAERKAQKRATKRREAKKRGFYYNRAGERIPIGTRDLGTLANVWPTQNRTEIRAPQIGHGRVVADEIW
jgi:5-methylcytosine-specific restriction endonuclease McrA